MLNEASRIRNGSRIATIAKALYAACTGSDDDIRWWEAGRYRRTTGSGDFGTVNFVGREVIAAFFWHESERYNSDFTPLHNVQWYFDETPLSLTSTELPDIMRFMSQMLLAVHPSSPIVTTGFWTEDGRIHSVDSRKSMLRNGTLVLRGENQSVNRSIDFFSKYYNLNENQISMIDPLRRLIAETDRDVLTIKGMAEKIVAACSATSELHSLVTPLTLQSPINLETCRAILSQIGIAI